MNTPSRSSFHQRLVARPGIRRSTSRASASAARRTSSKLSLRLDAHVDVDAPRAGGLREAAQAVLVEHLAHAQRHLADLVERNARPGVEVDPQLVGVVEVRAAHRPRVPVDHAEVDPPQQVGGVVGHELARVAPAGERHGGGLQPLGRAVRDSLLEERLAADAVHPALQHGRAIAQAAHDRLLALEVVVDEVELRQAGSSGKNSLPGLLTRTSRPPASRATRSPFLAAIAERMTDRVPAQRELGERLASDRPHRLGVIIPGIYRTLLVACGPFGATLGAALATAAIGRGLESGGLPAPDLCPLEDADGRRDGVRRLLDALDFDARMRTARAVILGSERLTQQTLLGGVTFEIATRARQGGVPAYAVARESSLGLFGERMLDLQVVVQAQSVRDLELAGLELAALV